MTKPLKSLIILLKTHQSVMRKITASLRGWDLNVNEFAAMEALASKGVLTTKQLINTVLIPNSSMSYVLSTLETKGYLNRIKDLDDHRVQHLSLTKQGQAYFERVYAHHYALMYPVFDQLSETEQHTLQQLLKRIGKYEVPQ